MSAGFSPQQAVLSQRLLVHDAEMCIQPQDIPFWDQFVVALKIVAPALLTLRAWPPSGRVSAGTLQLSTAFSGNQPRHLIARAEGSQLGLPQWLFALAWRILSHASEEQVL